MAATTSARSTRNATPRSRTKPESPSSAGTKTEGAIRGGEGRYQYDLEDVIFIAIKDLSQGIIGRAG